MNICLIQYDIADCLPHANTKFSRILKHGALPFPKVSEFWSSTSLRYARLILIKMIQGYSLICLNCLVINKESKGPDIVNIWKVPKSSSKVLECIPNPQLAFLNKKRASLSFSISLSVPLPSPPPSLSDAGNDEICPLVVSDAWCEEICFVALSLSGWGGGGWRVVWWRWELRGDILLGVRAGIISEWVIQKILQKTKPPFKFLHSNLTIQELTWNSWM